SCINMHKSKIMGVAMENSKAFEVEDENSLYWRKINAPEIGLGFDAYFFNGVELSDKKMSLVKWDNVLVLRRKGVKDDVPFKSLYPRLYALESDKKVTVATKIAQSDLCSLLRRMPRGGVEQ
ncbi:hypothetical protein Tco_1526399, partial [Tanacetum coccineum]